MKMRGRTELPEASLILTSVKPELTETKKGNLAEPSILLPLGDSMRILCSFFFSIARRAALRQIPFHFCKG